jgi:hypothetical protein
MAITFGGSSITTDSSTLVKNVNRTISDGAASGGQTAENFDSSGRPYAQYRPWAMQHINNPQGTSSYWTYSTQSNPDGIRNNISGSWVNQSTGRFTAPVTGLYQFGSHGIPTGNTGDTRFGYYVNDSFAARCICTTQNGSHGGLTGIPVSLYLTAGDYVNYAVYSGTGAHTGTWSGFSGCLVG